MSSTSSMLRVLYFGVGERTKTQVRAFFRDVEEHDCNDVAALQELVKNGEFLAGIHLVAAGTDFKGMGLEEMAQTVHMVFHSVPVFFVAEQASGFDRTLLVKNGFQDVFLLPIDNTELEKTIQRIAGNLDSRIYSPVRLVDIEPGTRLDFQIAVFLPTNNKYIALTHAGDVLDPERAKRLSEHKVKSVYVPVAQLQAFYKYSAKRLSELAGTGAVNLSSMSETERQQKLRTSVRELLTGMVSESYSRHIHQGKKVVDHTRSIVNEYIMLNDPSDWYKRLTEEVGQKGDQYSHAGNVATYAALFSVVLQVAKPEDMAIAGMIHDAGLSLLPAGLQDKKPEQMKPEELALYKTHPQLSIDTIKARKLIVSDNVHKAVLHHHEKWDGSGFPSKATGLRIPREAQVLAMADRFDYLTRVEGKTAPLSPDQAFRQMEWEQIGDPSLIRELRQLYDQAQRAAS